MAQFSQPDRQKAMASSATAQRYKAGLEIARRNLKLAADAGVTIAMGTDSGAFPERFQGYFEHLEMEMMVAAGMTPAQVLRSATAMPPRPCKRQDVGAIAAGKWADFVVLDKDPLADIRNTRPSHPCGSRATKSNAELETDPASARPQAASGKC
jgi:imidazolonepropionase-like amidohydrolase